MVKVNRWGTLSASCLVQASSGLSYSFAILAPFFKERFNYTDTQMSALASAVNLGGFLAIFSGQAYDSLQARHNLGPRVVLLVGCVLMVVGFGGMWAQAAGVIHANYGLMLACAVISGNAGTWWDTSVLATNLKNFPDDRGSVLGILKAFVGMSTSIYASIYWALFASGPASPPPPLPSPPLPLDPSITTTLLDTTLDSPSSGSWVMQLMSTTLNTNVNGSLAFLTVLTFAPSTLNLIFCIFINVVPADYHEPTIPPSVTNSGPTSASVTRPCSHQHLATATSDHQQQQQTALALHPHTHHHHHHQHRAPVNKFARFTALYILVAVVAVLQAGATLAGKGQPPGSHIDKLHALVLVGLLALVLLVPMSTGPLTRPSLRKQGRQAQQGVSVHGIGNGSGHGAHGAQPGDTETGLTAPLIDQTPPGTDDRASQSQLTTFPVECSSDEEEEEEEAPVHTNLRPEQAMCHINFWILFTVFMCGCASGLTLLNNIVPLSLSLGALPGSHIAFVSLFSVANASGRLLFGHLSEYYLHKQGLPRTVFLCIASGLMVLCVAALRAGAPITLLYVLSLLTGLAFGGHWSAIPAIASDLFGLGWFAGIYCILQLAPAIGAIGFASYIASGVLARESRLQPHAGHCEGLGCFRETWTVLSWLNVSSLVLTLWLWRRTQANYRAAAAHGRQVKA